MSYLRYLCLFVYSGVQHILCCILNFFLSCVPYVVIRCYVFITYMRYISCIWLISYTYSSCITLILKTDSKTYV
jgi:hypothetical protein